jgi:3'-phosphoadenosine 5'-phosphosulfate sulfotransferase (PAPS reductase)/FAD synthetase
VADQLELLPARTLAADPIPDLAAADDIIVSSSGGKDSQAMLDVVMALADTAGVRDRVVVLHCDLGVTPGGHTVEWPDTADIARRQADHYGLPFEVRRSTKWPSLLHRVRARGQFPNLWNRYCTSELNHRLHRELPQLRHWSPGELAAYLHDQPVSVIKGSSKRLRSRTERGKQPVSASSEVLRCSRESPCVMHGTFLVEHPSPGMGVESMDEKSNRAEEATGDVEGVTAGCSLASAGQDERCLPLRVADERLAQRLRIETRLLLQGLKLARGVGENTSQGYLPGIGVGVHPQGVAGLGADLELPGLTLLPDAVNTVDVAVDPVDVIAVDRQPAAAVHPRSPAARLGHLYRLTGQLGRQQTQRRGVQRWPVVQAQVVVGIGAVRTSRPTATQTHPNDAADLYQPICDLRQAFHGPQSAEADHQARPIYPTPLTPAGEVQRSTAELKRDVSRKFITERVSQLGITGRPARIVLCLGLRAEESRSRAGKPATELDRASSSRRTITLWYPILRWSTAEVWERIRACGTPYHWAYREGMSRLSCSLCVLASAADLTCAARLRPELAAEYAQLEHDLGSPFRRELPMAEIIERAQGTA